MPTSTSHFTGLPIRSHHSLLASYQGVKLWYLLLKIMGHLFSCSFWGIENTRNSWLPGLSLHLKEASLHLSGKTSIISLAGSYSDSVSSFQTTPVHNPGSFSYQKISSFAALIPSANLILLHVAQNNCISWLFERHLLGGSIIILSTTCFPWRKSLNY